MNDIEDTSHQTNLENHKRFQTEEFDVFGEFGVDMSPFVVSFSCTEDSARIWRLYGAEICLHIDSDAILEYCKAKECKHTLMGKVYYNEKIDPESKCGKKMHELHSLAWNDQNVFGAQIYTTQYKHPVFVDEDEWRLECFGKDAICSEIKSKGERHGLLFLYREILLPKECLKGITLRVYGDDKADALRRQVLIWLEEKGYDLEFNDIKFTKMPNIR